LPDSAISSTSSAPDRFEGVLVNLVYVGHLLKPGGIVVLDDYQLPAVAKATAYFTSNLGWMMEEMSPHDGLHQWAGLRTSTEPGPRPFDHFEDF
jgi:hypothetical protein